LAALVALPQAAEAVCSKSSLKGTWAAGSAGAAVISVNTNGRMPVFVPVFPFGGVLKINTFNGSCRGTGTVTGFIGGTIPVSLPVTITSERVENSSAVKPNLVVFRYLFGATELVGSLTRIQ
jgi:hypothetical protein